MFKYNRFGHFRYSLILDLENMYVMKYACNA